MTRSAPLARPFPDDGTRPDDRVDLAETSRLEGRMPGALAASLPMGAAQVVWRAPRLSACLAEAATLHRHLCPRQVLGVRMGLYGGELLGLELPRTDKRLFVFVETDLLRAERGPPLTSR